MKRKLFINVNCWGSDYIDGLLKYSIPCLLENLEIINKNELIRISFCICTNKNSINKIKKNVYFKKISKIIECKFIEIDSLVNDLKKVTKNKYQLLACVQNLMINYAKKKNYHFFMTLYPDFIFKKNSLKSLLTLIDKKDCDILVPIPQVIKEEVNKLIKNKGISRVTNDLENINFQFLHDIILNNNINDIKTNTPSLFCQIEKKYINFCNYHIHPIIIKLSLNRYKYHPFVKSLDEDFVKSIDYENKYYIIKDSNELLINSLLGKEELKLAKHVFKIKDSVLWLNSIMYEINKSFSGSVYTILKYKNYKLKNSNLHKIKKWIKNINKEIKPKPRANYHDDFEYAQNRFFSNIRNFLFEIQRSKGQISDKSFSKIISSYNLKQFSKFLKIFN